MRPMTAQARNPAMRPASAIDNAPARQPYPGATHSLPKRLKTPPPTTPIASQSTGASANPGGQDEGGPRWRREVEIPREIAQPGGVFTHRGARIWPSIGAGVEALSVEEVVLDELEIGIEAQPLVVDVAAAGIGADHATGNPKPVAVPVDH